MQLPRSLTVDLDGLLFGLFCGFAASLPFELLLEQWFGIDTIFKPFRVLALAIIGVYFLKSVLPGKLWTSKDRIDWFLYAVFAYGIAISCIRIVGGNFSLGLFMNDLFQSGLLVSTFFVFKATPFSHKQMLRMLDFFLLGISLNAGYILYRGMANNEWGRQAGFTDNPNYAAFGLVAAMIYLFLRFGHTRRIREMVAYGILAFFLLFAFMAEGSRTGLVVLVLVLGMVFWLQSTKRKILLAGLVLILGVGMTLRNIGSGATDGANVLLTRVNRSLVQGEEDVRFVIWRGMLNVFEDAGYVGMGIGQFKHRFSFYFEEVTHKTVLEMVNRGYYLSPHNDYLAIVADYGLPGLIFYLTFLWFAGWKLFEKIRQPNGENGKKLLIGFQFICFISIVVFGMAAENFQHQLYWFLLMFTTK